MKNDENALTRILVVDDQIDIRTTLRYLLSDKGYDVVDANSPADALHLLKNTSVDLVLTDMNFRKDTTSGQEGLIFVAQLGKLYPELAVLVMTAWSTVPLAVQAMQIGARDFIEKPWENHQLFDIIATQLKIKRNVSKGSLPLPNDTGIIYQSALFANIMEQIEKVSLSHASVLLTGENGTGKSLLAHHIHQRSPRCEHPFVSVNLGAVPEQLFESELFGHKRGAFTGAFEDRAGRIAAAGQGTLFLDELATTCMQNQAKLLRVLESKKYECVGSSDTKTMACRIISATNANIRARITENTFREDLYYRLNTVEIRVPALRERKEDILPIAHYYLETIGKEYHKPELTFSKHCQDKLVAHSWPGNTRELKHTIERAIIFSDSGVIELDHLSQDAVPVENSQPVAPLAQVEEALIIKALEQANGNINVSAELLGISRSALYRRIEKHGVQYKKYL